MTKDFKPEPPKSLVDGTPMPHEECEALADWITSGKLSIDFTPEARAQMAEKGLTEEELKKQILEGLLSGVRKS